MLLDILIPTNGELINIQPLLKCISRQSLQPDRILILIHKILQKEDLEHFQYFLKKAVHPELAQKIFILSNLTAEYEPGYGVGYDRNVLVKYARAKFVYMIDHDNIFADDLFERTMYYRDKIKTETRKESVVSPTIMRRKSGNIQSQGITGFSFFFPKYRFGKMGGEEWQEVKMLGANSLFGPREIFQKNPFDERFARCYEDIDFTYRVQQSGIPVIVLNKVKINHMEKTKTKLDTYFLGNPESAFERSRNRILFVKKVASKREKIQYFGFGLRIQTIWFVFLILLYGGKQRWGLWNAVIRGLKSIKGSLNE